MTVPGSFFFYRLIAVVRLRSGEQGEDYVRTYKTNGEYVPAQIGPDTYASSAWSLGDYGHSYMMFFVQSNESIIAID